MRKQREGWRRGEERTTVESWVRLHVSSLVVDRETHLPSLEDAGAARELDELDEAQCAYLRARVRVEL